MGRLREQMKGDLELRGLSHSTQEIYLSQVRDFSRHFNRSPLHLWEREIKEYLLYLIRKKKASYSHVNQCYCALKFLYGTTFHRKWVMEKVPCIKRERDLPVVLDREEVEAVFSVTHNVKHRAILMLIYSSGLRVSEAAHLKISDIDSKRMVLRIRRSKGKKDRYSILSTVALEALREYWREYHPKEWLFPSRFPGKPLTERSIQRVFKKASIDKYSQTYFCNSSTGGRHRPPSYSVALRSQVSEDNNDLSPCQSKGALPHCQPSRLYILLHR